jgi:hypothetical protein
MTTFTGILPILYNITEKEIRKMTRWYKKRRPNDKRSNEELRPFIINYIVMKKK